MNHLHGGSSYRLAVAGAAIWLVMQADLAPAALPSCHEQTETISIDVLRDQSIEELMNSIDGLSSQTPAQTEKDAALPVDR